jgi:hypothetical protein
MVSLNRPASFPSFRCWLFFFNHVRKETVGGIIFRIAGITHRIFYPRPLRTMNLAQAVFLIVSVIINFIPLTIVLLLGFKFYSLFMKG